MLHFMIDLENTRSAGLQGAEYLTAADQVTIFYSKACVQITFGRMQELLASGCGMEVCRLVNTGKNALDFYIASRIGEVYGQGFEGTIAIVSNDKGFRAVQDYWRSCVPVPRKIILRLDIEQSIVSANENSERRMTIQKKLKEINLETEYRKYEEKIRMRRELESTFEGTGHELLIDEIMLLVEGKKEHKVLYLNSLKHFGWKNGLEIYNRVKSLV